MNRVLTTAQEWTVLYGLRLVGAAAIVVIGRWAAGFFRRIFRRLTTRRMVDPTLATFGGNMIYAATMVFVALAALGQLGVETTSLVAVLGTASLAVGLALQGSLSNFAAGLLILVLRPFKVGDTISAAGVSGLVEELQFLTTQLRLPDNRIMLIPNSKLTGDIIVNSSVKGSLRAEFLISIGVEHDISHARALILEVLADDGRVLADPAPEVFLFKALERSLTFAVKPWVAAADFASFSSGALEELKLELERRGVPVIAARR